jgi:hypothetical protein
MLRFLIRYKQHASDQTCLGGITIAGSIIEKAKIDFPSTGEPELLEVRNDTQQYLDSCALQSGVYLMRCVISKC